MPNEIKLWRIEGESLAEWTPAHLDLEARLETWIERDVSVLSPDLLVIGRQVETDFGGVIDLLCLNARRSTSSERSSTMHSAGRCRCPSPLPGRQWTRD